MKKSNNVSTAELYDKNFHACRHNRTVHAAEAILERLINDLSVSSVMDFGCGVGTWLSVAKDLGVVQITGLEGRWIVNSQMEIDQADLVIHDLTERVSLSMRCDLAISTEVAEHLPQERASSFVEDLCKASDRVLFSAAVPSQGGTGHINEQWQSSWARLFFQNGYRPIDCVRPRIWSDPEISWWYKQNIILYTISNRFEETCEALDIVPERADQQLDIIHSELYLMKLRQLENYENIRFLFHQTCEVFWRGLMEKLGLDNFKRRA